jgi:hypothetical protein
MEITKEAIMTQVMQELHRQGMLPPIKADYPELEPILLPDFER